MERLMDFAKNMAIGAGRAAAVIAVYFTVVGVISWYLETYIGVAAITFVGTFIALISLPIGFFYAADRW